MKKILLFFGVLVMALNFTSCDKEGGTDGDTDKDPYENVPRSNVPTNLGPGKWQRGGIPALGEYDERGNRVANSIVSANEYEMQHNGYAKYASYVASGSSGCYVSSFAYYEGALYFNPNEPNTFLWTPVKGQVYTKDCSGRVTQDRAMTKAELESRKEKIYYKVEKPFEPVYMDDYIFMYNDASMSQSSFVGSYKIIK